MEDWTDGRKFLYEDYKGILNRHKISSLFLTLEIHFLPLLRRYLLFQKDHSSFLDTRGTGGIRPSGDNDNSNLRWAQNKYFSLALEINFMPPLRRYLLFLDGHL